MKISRKLVWLALALGLGGCHRGPAFAPPAFEDTPILETVSTADLPQVAPGFGIADFNGGGT